jgi:Peptidase inhibitor family I36
MTKKILRTPIALLTVAAFAAAPAVASAESGARPESTAGLVPTATSPTPQAGVKPDGLGSCPSSAFCMWENNAYGGTQWTYSINSYPQNSWFYVGSGANDHASSYYNDRVHSTYINQNYPANGGQACLPAGSTNENLGNFDWPNGQGANDSISAIYLANWNPC